MVQMGIKLSLFVYAFGRGFLAAWRSERKYLRERLLQCEKWKTMWNYRFIINLLIKTMTMQPFSYSIVKLQFFLTYVNLLTINKDFKSV